MWTFRKVAVRMLTLFSFFGAWLATVDHAAAAPIGMCADTAQSIAAPPPMFPADDKAVENVTGEECADEFGEGIQVDTPGAPHERFVPSPELPDQKVVLGTALRAPHVCSFVSPLEKRLLSLPEEHRWRGLRPPRP